MQTGKRFFALIRLVDNMELLALDKRTIEIVDDEYWLDLIKAHPNSLQIIKLLEVSNSSIVIQKSGFSRNFELKICD